MTPTFREKLFFLLPLLSLGIAGFFDHVFFLPLHPFTPWFFTIVVFFWGLHHPTILSGVSIFFMGFLMDILGTFPLGAYATIHLLLYWAALSLRSHLSIASFYWAWGFFCLLFFLALTLLFLILSFWYTLNFFSMPLLGTWVATCLAYPFISYALGNLFQGFTGRATRF